MDWITLVHPLQRESPRSRASLRISCIATRLRCETLSTVCVGVCDWDAVEEAVAEDEDEEEGKRDEVEGEGEEDEEDGGIEGEERGEGEEVGKREQLTKAMRSISERKALRGSSRERTQEAWIKA